MRFRESASILPVMLLFVAIGTGAVLVGMMKASPIVSPPYIHTLAEANAARASVLWLISYIVMVVVMTWNSVVAIAIVVTRLRTAGRLVTAAIFLMAMLVACSASIASAARTGSIMSVVDSATQLPIRYTSVASSTLAAGVVALTVAAVVALGRRSGTNLPAAHLRLRVGEARVLLFSAAASLAASLVALYLTLVWPIDLPAVSGTAMPPDVVRELAITVTLSSGIFYSAMLVILFVPISIIHERWIEESWGATEAQFPNQTRGSWLSENALDRSMADTAVQIVALAAPWLAAVGLPQL
jgi:hypothetical protein